MPVLLWVAAGGAYAASSVLISLIAVFAGLYLDRALAT